MKKSFFIILSMVSIIVLTIIVYNSIQTKKQNSEEQGIVQSTEDQEVVQYTKEWEQSMQEKAQEAEEEYEAKLPDEYKEQFPEDYKYFDLSNSWVTEEDRKISEEQSKWNREHPIYFSELGNYNYSYYDPDFIAPEEWYDDSAAGRQYYTNLYEEGKLIVFDSIEDLDICGRKFADSYSVCSGTRYGHPEYPIFSCSFSPDQPGIYVYAWLDN